MSIYDISNSGRINEEEVELLDAIPSPVFLMDADAHIVSWNRAAAGFLQDRQLKGVKAGDALRCEKAASSPGGCGSSATCGQCKLRLSVREATRGARSVDRLHQMTLERDGTGVVTTFLISASPICWQGRDLVFVFLKDISELAALRHMVPICMSCRKVRDDMSYWKSVDDYCAQNLHMDFTHGICPSCYDRVLQEYHLTAESTALVG